MHFNGLVLLAVEEVHLVPPLPASDGRNFHLKERKKERKEKRKASKGAWLLFSHLTAVLEMRMKDFQLLKNQHSPPFVRP